jgi:hypothetical protein
MIHLNTIFINTAPSTLTEALHPTALIHYLPVLQCSASVSTSSNFATMEQRPKTLGCTTTFGSSKTKNSSVQLLLSPIMLSSPLTFETMKASKLFLGLSTSKDQDAQLFHPCSPYLEVSQSSDSTFFACFWSNIVQQFIP